MEPSAINYSETRDLPMDAIVRLYAANGWSSANKPEALTNALRNSHSLVSGGLVVNWLVARNFILVSTDSDFKGLLTRISGANVVILRSCNYPTEIAAEVLRRNAIRIAELPGSQDHLIILDR